MTSVVSIDLAAKRWQDIGVAVLTARRNCIECRFQSLEKTRGFPRPDATELTRLVVELAQSSGSRLILIDGPQAWKAPDNGLEHCRVCENRLHTPAKTGLPGSVKPSSYLGFIRLSVQLFDRLAEAGFPRLVRSSPAQLPAAVESFPYAAWKSLQIPHLPSKARTRSGDIAVRLQDLRSLFSLDVERAPEHDELQALVAGLAGLALDQGNTNGYRLVGRDPYRLDDEWREGWIIVPRSTPPV